MSALTLQGHAILSWKNKRSDTPNSWKEKKRKKNESMESQTHLTLEPKEIKVKKDKAWQSLSGKIRHA